MKAMGVDQERLTKVWSLTQSDKDGEALAAFRTAEKMLARSGIALPDLINSSDNDGSRPLSEARRNPENDKLVHQVHALANQVNLLKAELAVERDGAIDLAHQISVLQDSLHKKNEEAKRWREYAWNILWDKES